MLILNMNNYSAVLITASEKGHLDIVKYLVENNANTDDMTIVEWASAGWLEKVQVCVESGSDVNSQNNAGEITLIRASEYGHLDVVKYLVENDADVNYQHEDGYTASIRASLFGHLEVVKYLVEQGADIKAKDNDGNTVLDIAEKNGTQKSLNI